MRDSFAVAAAVLMLAASAFAGGTQEGAAAGGVKIEFFQQKVEAVNTYATLIEAFQKGNPGIAIEQNTVPDPGTVLVSRFASGEIPEIFSDYPTQIQFRQKVANNMVRKLTKESFLSRVNPAMLDMGRQLDGEIYALPISQNFGGIYYHKDLFRENGIAIPRTYADLIEAARKLKAKGIVPFIFPDKNMVEHQYLIAAGSIYPNFLQDLRLVQKGTRSIADFPRFKRVADTFLELRRYGTDDSLGVSYPASAEMFANKAAAMTMLGSYALTSMMKANPGAQLAVFPFPGDKPEDTSALAGIDAAICLPAAGKRTKEGLLFLEFLSRVENAQIFSDLDMTPSCINGVVIKNKDIEEVVSVINKGKVTEWIKGVFETPVVKEHDNAVQSLLVHGDADKFLKEYQQAFTSTR